MSPNPARQFYDRISHAYDLIADNGEHAARERGLELLAVQLGESVLEIGFGTGHSLVTLAGAVGANGVVAGVDISSGMRDVALKQLAESGLTDRVALQIADVPPLPYSDDSFDALSMSFTLELFAAETIPSVLAECRRVLKSNGRLGVVSMATVTPGTHESTLEKTYIWMHTHFPHIVDCQPIALEELMFQAGFDLAYQERIDLFTMPVAIAVGINS